MISRVIFSCAFSISLFLLLGVLHPPVLKLKHNIIIPFQEIKHEISRTILCNDSKYLVFQYWMMPKVELANIGDEIRALVAAKLRSMLPLPL